MNQKLQSSLEIECQNERVRLCGDGAIFLPDYGTLLVADLHLGKDASFRAAGHPVPAGADTTIFRMLTDSLKSTKARRLIVLGDLIHNADSMTEELSSQMTEWRIRHPDLELVLVRGNHDRHVRLFPASWEMEDVLEMNLGPFQLVHETKKSSLNLDSPRHFQIGGHWHPVVSVGRGADRMRMRCFVIGRENLTLPAFGPFKGGLLQKRSGGLRFFPICDGMIWELTSAARVAKES